ncbi:MAG: hypothetical protein LBF28_00915 [Rickettsiales bacterium]|nr:hypothetical protein [Rickettsiales bacterium]
MNKQRIFSNLPNAGSAGDQHGASILEILLVMAIVALMSPFIYSQISEASREIRDIGAAKKIIGIRKSALNFVRLNQNRWPDVAQIKLAAEELAQITRDAHFGFVDKYQVRGAVITDVYLAFGIDGDALRAAQIAKHIGLDAATVAADGIAYGASWAAASSDFEPGDLIYRIRYNFSGDDNSKYLHRSASGEDDLNVMQRNLNMGALGVYEIGTASAQSGKIAETSASFAEAENLATSYAYFASGANMDGNAVKVGAMRVSGDITGFRNIAARNLNKEGFSTTGAIIADRATINKSIAVGKNMNIKSDTARTISGFAGITAHSLAAPYVYADEMHFGGGFGLTVSGELLMSTDAPLRIGSWIFPSVTPPKFTALEISRAKIPDTPNMAEFDTIIKSGWKVAPAGRQ